MENKLQKAETKYYVPDISEFHVGFEYEYYYDADFDNSLVSGWQKKEFDYKYALEYFNNFMEKGTVRVKCLDRTDLEELGWEVLSENQRWHYTHKDKSQFKLVCDIWTESTGFPVPHPNSGSIAIKDTLNDNYAFYGYIRNKSELRKIMEHLDIIQFKPLKLL